MKAAMVGCSPLHHPAPSTSLFLYGEPDPPEPMQVGDLGECFFPLPNTAVSSGPENFLCEMEAIPFNPVQSWLKHESSQGEGGSPASSHGPDLGCWLQRELAEIFPE